MYLNDCTEEEQKVLCVYWGLLKNDDFSLLNKTLEIAATHGHPSTDQIKHCFYSLLNEDNAHTAITPNIFIPKVPEVTRGLSHYYSFFQKGGIN